MDITITGRHCSVSESLQDLVRERLATLERLNDRVSRVEVEFTATEAKGSPEQAMQAEITLRSRGPVVRAEATAEDKTVAFDKALEKLKVQLRRASDRRKSHRGLRNHVAAPSFETATEPAAATQEVATTRVAGLEVTGDGPLVVREKSFTAPPLTLAQALDEMELVGHDFFLYVDAATQLPSVVYRRRAYDYGVIHLNAG